MNRALGICLALVLLPLSTAAGAQEMYKCKDAAGKITYSGKECRLIGLTSAGEITGRAIVTPAVPPTQASPEPPAAADSAPAPASPSAAAPPPPSDRRCFTVKTAKGTTTRCNDTPEEPADTK